MTNFKRKTREKRRKKNCNINKLKLIKTQLIELKNDQSLIKWFKFLVV